MKAPRLLLLGLLLCASVVAQPAQPGTGTGTATFCAPPMPITAVLAVVNTGQIEWCVYSSNAAVTPTSLVQLTFIATGPPIPTGGTVTFTGSFPGLTGCTAGAITQTVIGGAFGTMSSGTARITMTSRECIGSFRLIITAAAVTIYDGRIAINIHATPPTLFSYLCNATSETPDMFSTTLDVCNPIPVGNVTVGNQTLAFPDQLHLCGAPVTGNASACAPVAAEATANVFADLHLDRLLIIVVLAAIGAWLWAASVQPPVRLLGIVTEAFAGFYALAHRADVPGYDLLGLFILMVAGLFFLWFAVGLLLAGLRRRRANREKRNIALAQASDPLNPNGDPLP